jgi:hypothetical protein
VSPGGKTEAKSAAAKAPPAIAGKEKAAKISAAPKTSNAPSTARPGRKMPLVVGGGVVLLLMILGIVASAIYNQFQKAPPSEETAQTQPPSDSSQHAGTQANVPPVANPVEGTETVPSTSGESAATPEDTTGAALASAQHAPPAIATFLAEPAAITEGESTTLRWNTSETTLISVEPGLARGRSVGQVTVSPKQTTKYRLVARGLGGRKTQELTVTVKPAEEGPSQSDAKPNPQGMSLDALTRALAAGENVVSINQLMVRVGLNGVSFPVNAQAQAAILAAGERGERPKDAVVRLVDLAKQGGRR